MRVVLASPCVFRRARLWTLSALYFYNLTNTGLQPFKYFFHEEIQECIHRSPISPLLDLFLPFVSSRGSPPHIYTVAELREQSALPIAEGCDCDLGRSSVHTPWILSVKHDHLPRVRVKEEVRSRSPTQLPILISCKHISW